MRTLAIIQARMGSTRLLGKLARRLGRQPMIEGVVRRVRQARLVSAVVVATSDACEDETLGHLVPDGVPVVAGPVDDVLERFLRVLELFPADWVIRVCADNPFIDPSLIDRLVDHAARDRGADYVSFCLRDGKPVILTGIGVFAEVVRVAALRRAAESTTDAADREHVTRYLYRHPEEFSLRFLPVPEPLDRDDLRLTVDLPEDWEHAHTIYEALGPEPLEWHQIAQFVARSEPLRRRMAYLNRLCPKS